MTQYWLILQKMFNPNLTLINTGFPTFFPKSFSVLVFHNKRLSLNIQYIKIKLFLSLFFPFATFFPENSTKYPFLPQEYGWEPPDNSSQYNIFKWWSRDCNNFILERVEDALDLTPELLLDLRVLKSCLHISPCLIELGLSDLHICVDCF